MKISYGLSALGSPVHIDSLGLERGLACGCTCPSCGTPLVARQGDERVHHIDIGTRTMMPTLAPLKK